MNGWNWNYICILFHSCACTHTYIFYAILEISVTMFPDALEQQVKKQDCRLLESWKASDGNLDPNLALWPRKAMLDCGLWDVYKIFFYH